MNRTNQHRHVLILSAILLALSLLLAPSLPAYALTVAGGERQAAQAGLTGTETFIAERLDPWKHLIVVNEYFFLDADVLQMYFMVTSLNDPDINFEMFSHAFFKLFEDGGLPHDLVFLDIVDHSGIRLESYDFEPGTGEFVTATFGSQDERDDALGERQPLDGDFRFDDASGSLRGFQRFAGDDGDYIKIFFDLTNLGDATRSPFLLLNYDAWQDGERLTAHYFVEDYLNTTFVDLKTGETMNDCVIAFYLNDSDNPLDIEFSEVLGDGVFAFSVHPDGHR